MYSYSHDQNGGWIGRFEKPQDALAAGRACYGGDTRIYVGHWRQAMYSDMFIGARALLSYMKEDAAGKVGDEHVEAFDNLQDWQIEVLDRIMQVAIGEWEAELDEEQQFTGMHIDQVRGYSELEEMRRGHF